MTNFIDLEAITRQGPMFWAACIAVALGIAMVAAATVVQTKRLGRKFTAARQTTVPVDASIGAGTAEPDMVSGKAPREPVAPPTIIPQAAMKPVASRLENLLDRLDKVADRLDLAEISARSLGAEAGTPSAVESGLKEEPRGVEYVFRAAGG